MTEPETVASSRIFISYRREDTSGHVLALVPPLRERFGSERIFKDTDSIAPGQDFVKVIESQLQSCSVLLAIIGKDWVGVQDPKLKARRLDNPTDYLRVEVATALKNERVLVIPVLVGKASMPAREELPPDLEPLARRNALELSDIRWDSDVDRLIRAIEHACGESPLVRQAGAPGPTAGPPLTLQPLEAANRQSDVDQGETLDLLEERRHREIARHVGVAREALEAQDLEAVLEACKKAIWLDPQEPEARTLLRRAQTALNERKISEWLALAQESLEQMVEAPLGRTANEDLASAAELIDQALVLDPDHRTAVKLRQELLRLRKRREQQRDIERQVQGALASARASLDEVDFDSAIQHAGDALALRADCAEALDLRARALAAKEKDRREREIARRAEQTVKRARADCTAGRHGAAIELLEHFSPAHEIVSRALEELRRELDAVKEATRQDLLRKALAHVEDAAAAIAATRFTDALVPLQAAREIADRFDADDRQSEAWMSLNSSIEFLTSRRETARIEVDEKVAALSNAFSGGDYAAASRLLEEARGLDPERSDLRAWTEQIDRALANESALAEREHNIRATVREAAACLARGDCSSTLRLAGDILVIDPTNVGASMLKQRATAAIHRQNQLEEFERQAKQTIERAGNLASAGNLQGAFEALQSHDHPHELVSRALEEARARMRDREQVEGERQARERSEQEARDRQQQAGPQREQQTARERQMARQRDEQAVRHREQHVAREGATPETQAVEQRWVPGEQVAVATKIRVGPSFSSSRPFHLAAAAAALLVVALGAWRFLGSSESSSGGEIAAVTGSHSPTAPAEATSGEAPGQASNSPGVAPAADSPQVTHVQPAAGAAQADPVGASAATTADARFPRRGPPSQRLEQLTARAQSQRQRGQRTEALDLVVEGLTLDPKNSALTGLLDSFLRDAEAAVERSKADARNAGATSGAASEFSRALQEMAEGAKLRDAGRAQGAVRSFWAAAENFGKAAERSRQAASEQAGSARLVEEQTRQKQLAEEQARMNHAAAEEARNHQVRESARPSSPQSAAAQSLPSEAQGSEEDRVRDALKRYEAAFAQLSVSDVRGVYPSAPADQLSRTFGDLSSYRLAVQIQNVAFSANGASASVAGVVTHEFKQKSGRETRASRTQTFVLQKQGKAWVIVLIR